ncbi:hypothetical protein [Pararhizobium qamdonense]|uniref:hypothetical protein n=1 Tax=Pararhizobium qamdonense TaxID=3031126 RepID=UPI0023E26F30|nr:hypothetical protein [Pararhizobium qamdonense]
MDQEAVLEERRCDRYVGFLVETEEWEGLGTTDDGEAVSIRERRWTWRVTDLLTGATTEGPIPDGPYEEVVEHFDRTWLMFADSPYRPPVPEKPVIPASPYASHPNYGRF